MEDTGPSPPARNTRRASQDTAPAQDSQDLVGPSAVCGGGARAAGHFRQVPVAASGGVRSRHHEPARRGGEHPYRRTSTASAQAFHWGQGHGTRRTGARPCPDTENDPGRRDSSGLRCSSFRLAEAHALSCSPTPVPTRARLPTTGHARQACGTLARLAGAAGTGTVLSLVLPGEGHRFLISGPVAVAVQVWRPGCGRRRGRPARQRPAG